MLETLLKKFENYNDTCSIKNIRDGCVTFARDESYLYNLFGVEKDIWVIVPFKPSEKYSKKVKFFITEFPEYFFTLFHNYIHKDKSYRKIIREDDSYMHPSIVLGADGLKVINAPDDSKISFKHTGKLIIGHNVEIGPYSVIHCGTIDDTIIRDGCKFGAYTNIGHNCDVGENTVMAAGVILNGGVKVGKNCWFASGSLVRHHISICDDVVIGLGSVVLNDIDEPGIYVGTPAEFLRPIEEGWNF